MKIETMDKKDCCGCGACEQACPKAAISMQRDREGFAYPVIDKSLCINCGLCERVCGFEDSALKGRNKENQKYYWVKNRNIEERMRSRSGGFFYLLAKWMIENGGIVYGCILDENNYVRHVRASDIETCKKMQGSKYVESDISGIYSQVKMDTAEGHMVLFSGTACQVAGLYGFLQNNPNLDKLYTVDIVCHGASSPLILRDYIEFWEKKKGKLSNFLFRDKSELGWEAHVESFEINKKKYYKNNYTRLFYSKYTSRPSCSNCKFARLERISDFTLADFWGVKKFYPDQFDNKGISSIFVNTEKAYRLFNELADTMTYGEATEESIMQPNLKRPTPAAPNRDDFWDLYEEKGFLSVMKKYGGYDFIRRLKWYWEVEKSVDMRNIKRY